MNIAFDIDGTLFDYNGKPRTEIIEILKTLSKDHQIHIWSGGGPMYAAQRARDAGVEEFVHGIVPKDRLLVPEMDVCFDDMEVDLAKVNIKV